MEKILSKMLGCRIEVFCGLSTLIGEVMEVEDGILHLRDEKYLNHIAVDKISFIREAGEYKAGFVGDSSGSFTKANRDNPINH